MTLRQKTMGSRETNDAGEGGELMLDAEISSRRWERFDKEVYAFARECAQAEHDVAGRPKPPGKTLWAYEYITAFFERIDGEVFNELESLDEDLFQREVEERFVWLFHEAWCEEAR
jgi:hypothetical protein